MPSYRKTDFKKFRYAIASRIVAEGLKIKVDNKFFLIESVDNTISLGIPKKIKEPNFETRAFYSNCLGYDHDSYAYIYPIHPKNKDLPIALDGSKSPYFFENLGEIFHQTADLKLGNIAPFFRVDIIDKNENIPYSKKYLKVEEELRLYSDALRQIDPLFEFLNYYKIIERVSKKKSIEWINRNIHFILNFNFGKLPAHIDKINYKKSFKSGKRIDCYLKDVFEILRRKALKRIFYLSDKKIDIGEYFYSENRCGIAHANNNRKAKYFDFDNSEISKDNHIIKLLARIAIENKLLNTK